MTTTMTRATMDSVNTARTVERVIAGQPTSDGAGVKLTRVLTQPLQRRLDPFLMLDAFGTDNPRRLHRRLSGSSAPRLRDRHLHDRRPHAPSRQRRPRGPAVQRRRAVDDGRPRRDPFRVAGAGGRPDGRLPALAQPARQGQDARAVVPRHPERRDSRVHDTAGREGARDRRGEPRCRRRDAARGHRAAVSRRRDSRGRHVRAGPAGGPQRIRLRVSRRRADRRHVGVRAADGDPQATTRPATASCCRRMRHRARC